MREPGELERLAGAGDIDAATELGRRMLHGEWGREQQQRGVQLIDSAAARGHGEAMALAAMMAGAGVYRPQSWELALDCLQRSAELGWKPAQEQLLLLGAGGPAEHGQGADRWQALRRSVDLPAWFAVPPKISLSDSPKIRRVERFLSIPVCDWLIRRGRGKMRRAQVYGANAQARIDAGRTNSETDFSITETDLVLLLVRARIAAVTGLPTALMELTKVLHYEPGQRFDRHYDFIDPAVEGNAQDFPELGLRHRGRSGDALLFANCDARNQPDRRTLHAGLPPASGEKWLLSQWIRSNSAST